MNEKLRWLVVGLGNPGTQYQYTRHNVGFMAIDHIARLGSASSEKSQSKGLVSVLDGENNQAILVKPQTFMNLSGECVQPLLHFYKIPLERLIVIHDDIDQPFLGMKLHKNRGHGGHNGIRSISAVLGSADYLRIKLGVGRPEHPSFPVADYVLQKFSADEMIAIPDFVNKTFDAVEAILKEGFVKAANRFN